MLRIWNDFTDPDPPNQKSCESKCIRINNTAKHENKQSFASRSPTVATAKPKM